MRILSDVRLIQFYLHYLKTMTALLLGQMLWVYTLANTPVAFWNQQEATRGHTFPSIPERPDSGGYRSLHTPWFCVHANWNE
ncbi:hypothetical protein FA13DRAFT_777634 [Coprinellus micaceus]|uniref:Uncharacterized protein n=1 Tax=Coprinellus micaceus TaxID=71717 RepID=A0A4Y7T3I0_COPMI|nr:hypothetical protein FA13DRAFT_777634 [Coprinellus micaceus]